MRIQLDDHGILEIIHNDENKYTWHNYQVLMSRNDLISLRTMIDEYLDA